MGKQWRQWRHDPAGPKGSDRQGPRLHAPRAQRVQVLAQFVHERLQRQGSSVCVAVGGYRRERCGRDRAVSDHGAGRRGLRHLRGAVGRTFFSTETQIFGERGENAGWPSCQSALPPHSRFRCITVLKENLSATLGPHHASALSVTRSAAWDWALRSPASSCASLLRYSTTTMT